jgi:hypothetical protein
MSEAAAARVQWLGPAGQRLLFGAYAWFVTVAPVLAAAGAGSPAGLFAIAAPLPLVAAVFLEPRVEARGKGAPLRFAEQGAPIFFLIFSAASWLFGPSRPFDRLDRVGGIAAVAAWFLFAFIAAGPSYPRPARPDAAPEPAMVALRRRAPLAVLLAVVLVSLFSLGASLTADGAERRMLIALEAAGCGLVLVAGASEIFTGGDRGIRRPWTSLLVSIAIGVAAIVFLVARRRF